MLALLLPIPLLTRAHAHNDYLHPRPLLDALDQGFLCVEADIFLVNGELLVGHDRKDLVPGKTLEKLYLRPLADRVAQNHGHVYDTPGELTLLVDIKEDGEHVYDELKKELRKYRRILTTGTDGTIQTRAITVILSGDRPVDKVRKEKQRTMFIDGRLPDLDGGLDRFVAPLVSDDYLDVFKQLGAPLSRENHARLEEITKKAHQRGQRLRLWGTPDSLACWKEMYEAGVDLINTDKLADLRAYLLTTGKP
jgi:Glycerophosphoryl diester phosphodiesterase family